MSDPGYRATFFLSTGRCGTQWLAASLRAAFGDRARVEHEPLGDRYRPRRMLGAGELARLPPADAARIEAHVAEIERTLARQDYVETGYPCWSTLPYLVRRLAGRIRIVHLVRHPVPLAYSWQSHGAYVPPLLPHLPTRVLLQPTDAGTVFPEYVERWATLHPFECGLYFWAEVHSFGLRLAACGGVPWLRLQFEELFCRSTLERLCGFLEWPYRELLDRATNDLVDEHHFQLADWIEPTVVARHPRVCEVAAQLGYDPTAFDDEALRRRYWPGSPSDLEV